MGRVIDADMAKAMYSGCRDFCRKIDSMPTVPEEELIKILVGYKAPSPINKSHAGKMMVPAAEHEMQKPLDYTELYSGYVWLEYKSIDGTSIEVEPVRLQRYKSPVSMIERIGTSTIFEFNYGNYKKTWRCWRMKPTLEEQEASEWIE